MRIADYPPPKERLAARKYTVNAAFFETMTAEVAYWLGFALTDGCVTVRKRRGGDFQFVFSPSSKDREHLAKLLVSLQSDYPIHGPHKGVWQIMITSYPLCLSLERRGVVQRKSLVVQMPKVAKAFLPYLCRGIIDGNGGFNVYHRPSRAVKRNGKGRPATSGQDVLTINLSSTKNVCDWFKRRFGGSVSARGRIAVWQLTGERAAEVIRWCYADSRIPYLQRKRQRAVILGLLAS